MSLEFLNFTTCFEQLFINWSNYRKTSTNEKNSKSEQVQRIFQAWDKAVAEHTKFVLKLATLYPTTLAKRATEIVHQTPLSQARNQLNELVKKKSFEMTCDQFAEKTFFLCRSAYVSLDQSCGEAERDMAMSLFVPNNNAVPIKLSEARARVQEYENRLNELSQHKQEVNTTQTRISKLERKLRGIEKQLQQVKLDREQRLLQLQDLFVKLYTADMNYFQKEDRFCLSSKELHPDYEKWIMQSAIIKVGVSSCEDLQDVYIDQINKLNALLAVKRDELNDLLSKVKGEQELQDGYRSSLSELDWINRKYLMRDNVRGRCILENVRSIEPFILRHYMEKNCEINSRTKNLQAKGVRVHYYPLITKGFQDLKKAYEEFDYIQIDQFYALRGRIAKLHDSLNQKLDSYARDLFMLR